MCRIASLSTMVMSGDGRTIMFHSFEAGTRPDTNATCDVYTRTRP